MGEHADDELDRMEYRACEPRYWHRYGHDRTGFAKDTSFRNYLHVTRDGRKYRVGDMETSHLENSLRYTERGYCEVHNITDPTYPFQEILYNTISNYRCFMKELAYRRFHLQQPHGNYELLKAAISDILDLQCEEGPRYPKGRYVSVHVNTQNYPKPNKPKEIRTMQHKNLITLLQKDFYTIGVKFAETPQIYTYKVPNAVVLEKDNYVVTPSAGVKGFGVAKVVRIDDVPQIDLDAQWEYKWIVQKVDNGPYEAQIKAEEEIKKELSQVEMAHQRHTLVEKMTMHLPENSEARALFEKAKAKATALPFSAKEAGTATA